jgi:hypothetical protein
MEKREPLKAPDLKTIVGSVGHTGLTGNAPHDASDKQLRKAIEKIHGFLEEVAKRVNEIEAAE